MMPRRAARQVAVSQQPVQLAKRNPPTAHFQGRQYSSLQDYVKEHPLHAQFRNIHFTRKRFYLNYKELANFEAETTRLIREHKNQINKLDSEGKNVIDYAMTVFPASRAVMEFNLPLNLVKELLNNGAMIVRNHFLHSSPLGEMITLDRNIHIQTRVGLIAKDLIKADLIDVNCVNALNKSPLWEIIRTLLSDGYGAEEVLIALFQKGININPHEFVANSPFHEVFCYERNNSLKQQYFIIYLLTRHATVKSLNALDNVDRTPLDRAAAIPAENNKSRHWKNAIITQLIECGAKSKKTFDWIPTYPTCGDYGFPEPWTAFTRYAMCHGKMPLKVVIDKAMKGQIES